MTSYSITYSSSGYIVERISGQDFAAYVHEHIFQPLGMEHTALLPDLSDNTYVRDKRQGEKTYDTNGNLYQINCFPQILSSGTGDRDFCRFQTVRASSLRKEKLFKRPETWNELYQTTSTFSDKQSLRTLTAFG